MPLKKIRLENNTVRRKPVLAPLSLNEVHSWHKVVYSDDLPAERRDLHYFRRYGIDPQECWYSAPQCGTAMASQQHSANILYAIPFVCPKQITLDRIAIRVIASSAGQGRLGIYNDNGNLYPSSLVLDAGTVDTGSGGIKSITISQTLNADTLYWLVVILNATPNIQGFNTGSLIPILGISTGWATTPQLGYSVSQTYGALPSTFPTGASTLVGTPIPVIAVRLSA